MALSAAELTEVARIALAAASVREALAELRIAFPGLRFSSVAPEDMRDETPAVNLGERSIFLMTSEGHCWSVTRDPAVATGVVLCGRR